MGNVRNCLVLYRSCFPANVGYTHYMISKEPGIMPGSHYYYFPVSEEVKEFFNYLVWSGHYHCRRGYSIQRDYFPYLLLAYAQKGKLNVTYEGEHYSLKEGDLLLIDCQLPHHYYSDPEFEFSYFHFDGGNSHQFCRKLIQVNGSPLFRTSANTEIGRILNETNDQFLAGIKLSTPEISQVIYNLLMKLAQAQDTASSYHHIIDKAVEFINQHPAQNLRLEELSNQVHLSPYYFARLFKRHTGFSPLDYALKCKMDRAIFLLKTTDHSVGEIAYSLGYGSEAAFGNAFKRTTGMPPGKFRKLTI